MKPLALAAVLLLAACQHGSRPASAQDAFFARLEALCGQSFQGRLASPPTPADAAFAAPIVMRVADCSANEIRMPLAVGEDRSRTWVVTRTARGLTLKHDHRHADGSEDAVSQYGGDAVGPGLPGRQQFPADAFSRALFVRENIPVSADNVWAMEVEPGRLFAYELARPGRLFRLEFDLR